MFCILLLQSTFGYGGECKGSVSHIWLYCLFAFICTASGKMSLCEPGWQCLSNGCIYQSSALLGSRIWHSQVTDRAIILIFTRFFMITLHIYIQSSTHMITCMSWPFLYRMGPSGSISRFSGGKFCIWHKEKLTFCKRWSCRKKTKLDLLSYQYIIHVPWTCRVKNPRIDLGKACLSLLSLVFFSPQRI